tara:strand:- start:417 stop:1004 length:588 start_codon:yes stop_codon:yes gene_type:complete
MPTTKSTKKTKPTMTKTVTPDPVVTDTDTEVQTTDVDSSEVDTVSIVLKRMAARRAEIMSLQRQDRADSRVLEKLYASEIRTLRKKRQRGGGTGEKKEPSGFAKPTEISPELRKFLGVPENTLLARTDVTKRITDYISEHKLQNPENKREILFKKDKAFQKLINMEAETKDELTYFNLQRCIKHHFPKKTKAGTA